MVLFANFIARNDGLLELIEVALQSQCGFLGSGNAGRKSAPEAVNLRNLGNSMYCLNKMKEAFEFYSRSIAVAPTDSEELALAFGNRSATLFYFRRYEFCLLDINRALKGRLPERSKPKLLKRKKDCWAELIAENELKSSVLEGRKSIFPNEALDSFEARFCYVNEMSIEDTDFISDRSFPDHPIWNTKLDNPLLRDVSSKVKLNFSPKLGRHLVATQNIAPGEVLAIENLFSLRTTQKVDQSYIHCAHCSVWCEALIPCPTCSLQMYCSERCRKEAHDSYHRIECKVLPLFSYDENQESVLFALRMFLIGTKQGSDIASLMNDPNVYDSLEGKLNCIGVPYTSDYLSILNMNWQIDYNNTFLFTHPDKCSLVSTLFGALRRVNFFKNEIDNRKNSDSLTDIELFTGLLLFHHVSLMRQSQITLCVEYIGEELYQEDGQENNTNPIKDIGSGISSFIYLMNHSCNPNTSTLGNKRRHLIYSCRSIKAGEQITSPYCFSFSKRPREWRRDHLQEHFHFVCHCEACVQNWPIGAELIMMKRNKYLTSDKKSIREVEKMQKWMMQLLTSPTVVTVYELKETYLQKVCEFSKNIRRLVKEPAPIIFLCEEFIKNCMKKRGNCYSVMPTVALLEYLKVFKA